MKELRKHVLQWAHDKGIMEKARPVKQLLKTQEEMLELMIGIEDENIDEIKDAIGDVIVTLIIFSEMKEIDPFYKSSVSNISTPTKEGLNSIQKRLMYQSVLLWGYEKMYPDSNSIDKKIAIEEIMDCLTALALYYNTSVIECLKLAYIEIKGRTGKMINGTFVKDTAK